MIIESVRVREVNKKARNDDEDETTCCPLYN